MNPKSLKQAANEINVFFDLDPAIDLNQKPESLERMLILECAPLLNPKKDKVVPFDQITPEDDFLISEETIAILTELGAKYREEIDKSLKPLEINVLKFFNIIDAEEPVVEEPLEGEEVKEGTITEEEAIAAKETVLEVDDQDLAEEIKSATKLKELKDIAQVNEQFKSIRGKLSSYKTVDDLSSEMLELYYAAEQQAKAEEGHEKNIESKGVNEIITEPKAEPKTKAKEAKMKVVKEDTPAEPEVEVEPQADESTADDKPKKEKVARVHNEDHKTRAQIFADIFQEGKPLTMNEWTKEMDSRSDSNSIATARTFTSIYMQILLELGIVVKTKDGKLVKA
jgi:hypothetical protein